MTSWIKFSGIRTKKTSFQHSEPIYGSFLRFPFFQEEKIVKKREKVFNFGKKDKDEKVENRSFPQAKGEYWKKEWLK